MATENPKNPLSGCYVAWGPAEPGGKSYRWEKHAPECDGTCFEAPPDEHLEAEYEARTELAYDEEPYEDPLEVDHGDFFD